MSKQYAWTSKSKFQNSCLLKCLLKIILGLFNRQFASSFDFVYVYWFPSCYESCKFAYGFDLASVLIPVIAVVFLGPWEGQGFRALYHEIQHVHPKKLFQQTTPYQSCHYLKGETVEMQSPATASLCRRGKQHVWAHIINNQYCSIQYC